MVRHASLLAFSLAAIGAACSAQRPGSGAYSVTPLYRPNVVPVYLGVDGNHLFARGGDANTAFDLEHQQDGCARGSFYPNDVEVCPVPEEGTPGKSTTWRLKGPFGTRTFTMEWRDPERVYVDFGINLGRVEFLLPKKGLPHDHPEMVAAAFFSGAFGVLQPRSETQAYLIEARGA